MKLWQKIFLLTLALVIAVVNVTSLIFLVNNHNLAIKREQQEALSRHNYVVEAMQNRIIYTQLINQMLTLNDDEVMEVAREVLNSQRSDASLSLSLYRSSELLYTVNQITPLGESELAMLDEEDYASLVIESDESTYLLLVSTVVLNDTSYQLVSSSNITSTYTLFEADVDLVSIISVVSGLFIAGILLVLTRGLLGPLQNLSAATRLIAEGDLDRRAVVTGHDEVSEVASNFNVMADSIEHNVKTLEDVAEARRIFIGNLAHEMKTPLTSILGFADLLRIKRSVSDEERREYADIIVEETKHLQGLSGKLMELLTTKNVQLSFETIDSLDYVQRLQRALEPLFERTKTSLVVSAEPFSFEADRGLLTSLLYNLIDNAVKASPPGKAIMLSFERKEGEPLSFCITVSDEGAGIPADQIPLLTEPFYMLDKARTRKHGGAGLGLALCVEIVQAHGGTLTIESKLEQGTQVRVVLPLHASPDLLEPGKDASEGVSNV